MEWTCQTDSFIRKTVVATGLTAIVCFLLKKSMLIALIIFISYALTFLRKRVTHIMIDNKNVSISAKTFIFIKRVYKVEHGKITMTLGKKVTMRGSYQELNITLDKCASFELNDLMGFWSVKDIESIFSFFNSNKT